MASPPSSSSRPSDGPAVRENVFLFIPNVIGYFRVILALTSFYFLSNRPWIAMLLYSISCLLDAVDGHAARYFKQTSRFGAVLDMVTDRSTTTCLLVHLTLQHPQLALLFQVLISLDLSSHYMHMYSSLTSGASSHKVMDSKSNPLLRLYYTSSTVLFLVCAGNELFFIAWYLTGALPDEFAQKGAFALAVTMFPIMAFKQILNVVQLVGASRRLAEVDLRQRQLEAEGKKSS
ncbi:CDP-alcohol phosphatidyltransferase-domain-containing protein [Polychytrium aggregatum]|uniref:CDP-alcohol phosphatidyltransferase-domain-containing protein n=1 Tax=Polychytrium aggregatum TaxID=110093 RepID=UPI0022FE50C2|nr:CDP-alcohol phosphatidyltransferase-domain-containing protein [Polychytrium aggregatum]KAI9206451.1 CDP-alcohol phosphatidyltransferase-domain-containing protein [Polychytrium aggregatum]